MSPGSGGIASLVYRDFVNADSRRSGKVSMHSPRSYLNIAGTLCVGNLAQLLQISSDLQAPCKECHRQQIYRRAQEILSLQPASKGNLRMIKLH